MSPRLRRAEQVERNRELLLEAARRVFLERGYAGSTLESVADAAGFSKGVVYSQFGSKVDLFLALLDRRIDERAAENQRVADGLAGADGLRALLRAATRDEVAEPGWSRLLVEFRAVAARDPEINQRYADAHDRTVRGIEELLDGLHGRAGLEPAVPLRSMAELILAFGSGATLERAANPQALPERDLLAMLPRALGLEDAAAGDPPPPVAAEAT